MGRHVALWDNPYMHTEFSGRTWENTVNLQGNRYADGRITLREI